jgi:hypothetical protein
MCFIAVGSGGCDVPSLLSALSSRINAKVKGWVIRCDLRLCSTNHINSLQRHLVFSYFNSFRAKIEIYCLGMLFASALNLFFILKCQLN